MFGNKIDRMVGMNFLGPYVMSFLIAEFVLVMQFLWKYIDDITGKGIGFFEIMELVIYFAGTIIPKAIPITILLSSVFVFGNMSEKFELTSLKTAGISLVRVMRMGFYLAIFTALFSLFASNYLVPKANYEFFSRFDVIKRQKPALTLEAKIFNKDFTGYNIYIKDKAKDGRNVEGVMIYDEVHSSFNSFSIVTAKKGVMSSSDDGKYFIMNLEDGEQYRQTKERKRTSEDKTAHPFIRTKFDKWEKIFPMSEFDVDNKIFYAQRRKYDLMNTFQLFESIDSINTVISDKKAENYNKFSGLLVDRMKKPTKYEYEPTEGAKEALKKSKEKKEKPKVSAGVMTSVMKNVLVQDEDNLKTATDMLSTFKLEDRLTLVAGAISNANQRKDHHINNGLRVREKTRARERIRLVLHQMYSWASICIIFLFIGAPLGSIIRKGGFGYPLLSAIVLFMIFIILSIIGDKLQRSQTIGAVVGAWLPCIVMAPMALYLTLKALDDQKLVEMNWLTNLVARFKSK